MKTLTLKEEIILSALTLLGGTSRGALISKQVIEISKKEIVYGTLYNLMEILIRKGYVITQKSEPVPEQGGRSKTIYTISDEGKDALKETVLLHDNIRKSLQNFEFVLK
jgi:DNA-binding PadR family transcriptional regulator